MSILPLSMKGSLMPPHITFEVIGKAFMELCSDRYFSSSKVLDVTNKILAGRTPTMDPDYEKYKTVTLKILIISRFRDMVREVSLNQIFQTALRRDELYMAIIEALEDLEDEYEEIENQYNPNAEE
ncbi:MAG: hypothetical protein ACXWM7_05320 [Parachlamydiaceae bacterium]